MTIETIQRIDPGSAAMGTMLNLASIVLLYALLWVSIAGMTEEATSWGGSIWSECQELWILDLLRY